MKRFICLLLVLFAIPVFAREISYYHINDGGAIYSKSNPFIGIEWFKQPLNGSLKEGDLLNVITCEAKKQDGTVVSMRWYIKINEAMWRYTYDGYGLHTDRIFFITPDMSSFEIKAEPLQEADKDINISINCKVG